MTSPRDNMQVTMIDKVTDEYFDVTVRECGDCYALVRLPRMTKHVAWHRRNGKRMTKMEKENR